MLLSGVWDRFPRLHVLIAHSGGTLPFLAGRIESCITHDAHLQKEGRRKDRRDVWDVLKNNVYLDAVIYGDVGLKAAFDASGVDRLMFGTYESPQNSCKWWPVVTNEAFVVGTDHPFFPPLKGDEKEWLSVTLNSKAVKTALRADPKSADAVMGGNAMRILRLNS